MEQVAKTSPFKYPAKRSMKKCSVCLEVLPLNTFPQRIKKTTGKLFINPKCRKCTSRATLNSRFKRDYGITREDYKKMAENQQGKCLICRETGPDLLPSGRPRLVVDHNHETGLVRGLLCNPCNWKVGIIETMPPGQLELIHSYI